MIDPGYASARALASILFEQHSSALSKSFRRIVEDSGARGFTTLTGPAVGQMTDATVKHIRAMADEVLSLYERSFVDVPSLEPETIAAVRDHLVSDFDEWLSALADSCTGYVASLEGGANWDGQLDREFHSSISSAHGRATEILRRIK